MIQLDLKECQLYQFIQPRNGRAVPPVCKILLESTKQGFFLETVAGPDEFYHNMAPAIPKLSSPSLPTATKNLYTKRILYF